MSISSISIPTFSLKQIQIITERFYCSLLYYFPPYFSIEETILFLAKQARKNGSLLFHKNNPIT